LNSSFPDKNHILSDSLRGCTRQNCHVYRRASSASDVKVSIIGGLSQTAHHQQGIGLIRCSCLKSRDIRSIPHHCHVTGTHWIKCAAESAATSQLLDATGSGYLRAAHWRSAREEARATWRTYSNRCCFHEAENSAAVPSLTLPSRLLKRSRLVPRESFTGSCNP
jgi:hypothetical protein